MPDACPSGGGRATIPVGGGIEVENAIIPGAHSADIFGTPEVLPRFPRGRHGPGVPRKVRSGTDEGETEGPEVEPRSGLP